MNKKVEMLKELFKNAMLESVADGEISATEAMDQILEFSAETFGELIHRQGKSSDEESKVPESIRELLQDVIQKAKGDPKLKALHCIVSGPGASEILKDIKDMFQDNDMPSGADKEEPAEEDQEKDVEDYIEELADLLKAVDYLTGTDKADQEDAISQNAVKEFSEFLELLVPEYDVPSDFFSQPDVKKLKDITDYSFVVSYKHITVKIVMIDRPEGYFLFGQDGKVCIYDADGKYIRDMTSEEMDDAILR